MLKVRLLACDVENASILLLRCESFEIMRCSSEVLQASPARAFHCIILQVLHHFLLNSQESLLLSRTWMSDLVV